MLLEVDGLVVCYGGITALHGVGLNVDRGEVVAVLGPNGAGKTSLLRAISGLTRPAQGSVRLNGRSIVGQAAHAVTRAGFVHVPEGRAMIAPLSVAENLLMGAYLLESSAINQRLEQMLTLFPQLRERLKLRAGLLSGGEQQMLAIARGLMSNPAVLAIDEPSMGLAPVMVEKVIEALHAVMSTGTSILLVEQNTNLALDVAQRAYVLIQGEVVASGQSDELRGDILATYLT